ncbi:MAG TPA: universal stress protein [Bacteroidales bacterium]|nr:universal stress protein [Bacteroidales bacterium]HRZ75875.1 universal stress protein [Bacteroidales bacterium]
METIILLTEMNYPRAALLQSMLSNEGIPSFLSNINEVGGDVSGGVKIMIRQRDLPAALRVLQSAREALGERDTQALHTLKGLRRILVPVDFSPHSQRAAHFALGLARELKGEVHLLHAYYSPAMTTNTLNETFTYPESLSGFLKEMAASARRDINALAEELRIRVRDELMVGVNVHTSIDNGLAEDVILEKVQDLKPGVIVMGTKGQGNVMYRYLGSVAGKVMESVSIPVLAIPASSGIDDPRQIDAVVYATAFDEKDTESIGRLMSILAPFRLRYHCLHVETGDDPSMDEARMQQLRRHLAEHYAATPIQCEVIHGQDVARSIEHYVLEREIGLIATTSRQRNFLERLFYPSTTRQILFKARTPVLVFHA